MRRRGERWWGEVAAGAGGRLPAKRTKALTWRAAVTAMSSASTRHPFTCQARPRSAWMASTDLHPKHQACPCLHLLQGIDPEKGFRAKQVAKDSATFALSFETKPAGKNGKICSLFPAESASQFPKCKIELELWKKPKLPKTGPRTSNYTN